MKLQTLKPPQGHVEDGCVVMPVSDLHPLWGGNNLTEATFKEIASLIDGNFLNQRIRAEQLKSVNFAGFDNDTMRFTIPSSEFDENGIKYMASVQFEEWDEIGQDPDFNNNEKARLILWIGNLKMHCSCPSFLYHYQYNLTAIDASIYPEERAPVKTNPDQRGIVCKHLNLLLRVIPFNMGYIAQEMKKQFGEG